jgi:hypothetical protein
MSGVFLSLYLFIGGVCPLTIFISKKRSIMDKKNNLKVLSVLKVDVDGIKRFLVSSLCSLFFALLSVFSPLNLNGIIESKLLHSLQLFFFFTGILSIGLKLLDERYEKKYLFQSLGVLFCVLFSFFLLKYDRYILRSLFYGLFFAILPLWGFFCVASFWKEKDDHRLSLFLRRLGGDWMIRFLIFFALFLLILFFGKLLGHFYFIMQLLRLSICVVYWYMRTSFLCSIPQKEVLYAEPIPLKEKKNVKFVKGVYLFLALLGLFFGFVFFADKNLFNGCWACLLFLFLYFLIEICVYSTIKEGDSRGKIKVFRTLAYVLAWVFSILLAVNICRLLQSRVEEAMLYILLGCIVSCLLLIIKQTSLKRKWVTIMFTSFLVITLFSYGSWSFRNMERRYIENRVVSLIKEGGFDYPLKSEKEVYLWRYGMSYKDAMSIEELLKRYNSKYVIEDLMDNALFSEFIGLEGVETDNRVRYDYEKFYGNISIPNGYSSFREETCSHKITKDELTGEKTEELIFSDCIGDDCIYVHIPIDTALYYCSFNIEETKPFFVEDQVKIDGKNVKVCLFINGLEMEMYEEQVTKYGISGILFFK